MYVKIAEDDVVEVYELQDEVKTSEGPSGEAPEVMTTAYPKTVDKKTVGEFLDDFKSSDIEAISVSRLGGVTVRVYKGTTSKAKGGDEE